MIRKKGGLFTNRLKPVRKERVSLGIAFIVGIWIVFALLCLYVYFSGKEGRLEDYTGVVGKYWYLILILGFLVFITKNDIGTLFTHWKAYLIVLVVFIIIDSLLFLELHFTKIGGQALKSAKVQVGVTELHCTCEELNQAVNKYILYYNKKTKLAGMIPVECHLHASQLIT